MFDKFVLSYVQTLELKKVMVKLASWVRDAAQDFGELSGSELVKVRVRAFMEVILLFEVVVVVEVVVPWQKHPHNTNLVTDQETKESPGKCV